MPQDGDRKAGEGGQRAKQVPVAEVVTTSDQPVATSGGGLSFVEPVLAQPVLDPPIRAEIAGAAEVVPGRSWLHRIVGAFEWLFGAASLIVILAVVSTVPVLQLLSLGYLLEAAGSVAKTGRLRAGFIGVRQAARIGSLVVGTWLWLLPLRFLASLLRDAELIEPGSLVSRNLRIWLIVLSVLIIGHILWAWQRGGRFRDFLWPAPIRLVRRLYSGGMFSSARDAVWHFVAALRLPYLFWLGLRGFVGALIWLVVPVTMLAAASGLGGEPGLIVGILGGFSLATVLLYLPFLQTRMAVENRFRAMFEVSAVRALFRQAPIAFWMALVATLLFALPLYLLKIELTPREVAWLPSLLFVVFIFPARLLSGWALGRALRRPTPRHFIFRWAARLSAIPVVGIYVLIVYATQYLSWYGVYSLYEQHAFLVPAVPYLGI